MYVCHFHTSTNVNLVNIQDDTHVDYKHQGAAEPGVEMSDEQYNKQSGRNVERSQFRVSFFNVPVTHDTLLDSKSVTSTCPWEEDLARLVKGHFWKWCTHR